MNIFEAQLAFLRLIKEMREEEEIYFDGDYEVGFETLLEEYEKKTSEIVWRFADEPRKP